MTKLAPCPCGGDITDVLINSAGQGGKWAYVAGNCCGSWEVEFRTSYHDLNSPECKKLAIEAWNNAPRVKI